MRWSLAGRLTVWYTIAAFVVLAGVSFIQYRTLALNLADEDDQLLVDRLAAEQSVEGAPASRAKISREDGPYVRVFDTRCHIVKTEYHGPAPPPARCDASRDGAPVLRRWESPDGQIWRVVSQRSRAGWVEVMLDRRLDEGIVQAYREQLIIVLGVALVVLASLGYLMARRGLLPLSALAARMSRVDAHSLDQRLGGAAGPAEIRPVAESFDRMLERLEAAFQALADFSTDLAHEFRTPLHILRQQAEVVLAHARPAEEYREVLSSALEELDRLRRMVDDTLFLARAEDPRASIEQVRLGAAAELGDVAEYLDSLALERGVALDVRAPGDLIVKADRMLFRRALANLVTNAIRYTPTGGRITLAASESREATVVEVQDTGAGIPAEALPRIFDRYFRVPGENAASAEGTGLGLAIVRSIMSLHGGTVAVSSQVGGGTRVTLRFPTTPYPAESTSKQGTSPAAATAI